MYLYQPFLARAFVYLNLSASRVCTADSAPQCFPGVTDWRIIIQSSPLEYVLERQRRGLIEMDHKAMPQVPRMGLSDECKLPPHLLWRSRDGSGLGIHQQDHRDVTQIPDKYNGLRLKMPLMEVCLHGHGAVRQQGREPTAVKPGHNIEFNSSAFSDLENRNQMAKNT